VHEALLQGQQQRQVHASLQNEPTRGFTCHASDFCFWMEHGISFHSTTLCCLYVLLQVLLLIGGDVLEHCMAMVRQLKGITATYRMTAKGPPVRHSHYVAGKRAADAVLFVWPWRCDEWR
jgi:hypothetical protein